MKKALLFSLFFLLCSAAKAAPHSVIITFTKSVSDTGATGTGYFVWRQFGSCPANLDSRMNFLSLTKTVITTNTFTDTTVTLGSYCYVVTFVGTNGESDISNAVTAVVVPAAPTGLGATAQ